MKNQLIDVLNQVLINTMDYKMMLQKLSANDTQPKIGKKVEELINIQEEESKALIKIISALGGDMETTQRLTDQDAIYWFPRPLADPEDFNMILNSLIEAERKKEQDYHKLLAHEELEREHKNHLDNHRKESEKVLTFFQSIKITIDNKSDR